MNSRLIFIFCLLLFSTSVNAQTITEKFGKLTISENFDSVSSAWTTLATGENLFIMQDGEYILQRRAGDAPFAIVADFKDQFKNFRAVTSLKIDNTMSEEATIGLLFMMQEQGKGGFLIEINRKKEYRLRQISGGIYKYITGTSKNGGWQKSYNLNEPNVSNMIEIKSFNGNYDLFINGAFMMSFSEPGYKSGKLGFIIGPKSRGKIDFLYVFTQKGDYTVESVTGLPDSAIVKADADIIELAESIILLKTQVNSLQEENDDLKKIVAAMKSGDQEKDVTVRNLEKKLKSKEDELIGKISTIDSLEKANTELKKYKELVGDENGDIVISLSKALKTEKEKNKQLQDEIDSLKKNNTTPSQKSANPKTDKPSEKTSSGKSKSNTFSLPDN